MDSEHRPLVPSEKHSSDTTIKRSYGYKNTLQKMVAVVSKAFIKMYSFGNLVVTAFLNFDNWRRSSCLFYSLAWIFWTITAMSLPSFTWKLPLTVVVFPAFLWGLYLLQSMTLFFIAQTPVTELISYVGFALFHEFMYQKLSGNLLLTFAFAFQQTGLILQYKFYSVHYQRLIRVEFQQKGTVLEDILVLHLFVSIIRSILNGDFVEAGVLLIPILVGFEER